MSDINQGTPCRWLRFSLRSLFLLILIVAAYFGGWRSAWWTAEREKEAAVRKAVDELRAAQEREGQVRISLGSDFVLGGLKEFTVVSSVEEILLPGESLQDVSQATAAEEKPPLRSPQTQPEAKAAQQRNQ